MSRLERLYVVADAFDSGLNVRQRHGRRGGSSWDAIAVLSRVGLAAR